MSLHETTADIATHRLRALILSGSIKPGQPLRQDKLARELAVSRTPLRQAFQVLSEEGLVSLTGFKGARVVEIDRILIDDLFDMRMALEPIALGSAIANMTKIDLAKAEMVLDDLETQGLTQANTKNYQANWAFHEALYTPSKRYALMDAIRRLNLTTSYASVITQSIECRVDQSHQEHHEILAHCRAKDRDAALSVLRDHLKQAHGELVRTLSDINEG